jgi:ADP-heptose:LPS heptosyltransferase
MTSHNAATIDLSGKGNLNELVLVAWAATAAIGPDNGIMHLIAVAGCKSVVLYDQASDPALVGPRGSAVTILRRPRLTEVPVGEVIAAAVKGRPAGTAQTPRPFS